MTPTPVRRVRAGLDLRLLIPALVGWAGILAVVGAGGSARTAGVVAVCWTAGAVVLLVVGRRHGWASIAALTCAVSALLSCCLAGHLAVREASQMTTLAESGVSVVIEGLVIEQPRPVRSVPGRIRPPQTVLTVLATTLSARGSQRAVSVPVLVVAGPEWAQVPWLARVTVSGRLAPSGPGDEVVAVLRSSGSPMVMAEPPALARAADVVRARFHESSAGLPDDASGLVPALVLGDTSGSSDELTEAMRQAGLSHLSAVSGSNVSLILAAVVAICVGVGVPRRWRPPLAALGLAGFVVLVRPEPSVIRAAAMGLVGLLALGAQRERLGVPALCTSIVALLGWDPWLARSHGFALSVLATLGLLLFARPWGEAIGRRLPLRIRSWGPALAVPVCAQLMVAPVVVLLQGSVSLVAVPANLVAAPFVAPATICGVAVAGLGLVWPWAAQWLAWTAGLPAQAIAVTARAAAEVPMGSLPWPAGPWGAAALAAITAVLVLTGPWLLHRARAAPVAVLVVVTVATGAGVPVSTMGWPPAQWAFVACSVGQGDALVLATTPGRAVLVDVGPVAAPVLRCLRLLGVHALDAIVLTHFHVDHVGGLAGVLGAVPVREVMASAVTDPPDQVARVMRSSVGVGVGVTLLHSGDRLSWPGLSMRVWWPGRRIAAGSVPNNGSLVLTTTSHAPDGAELHTVLLGDIEREAARAVLESWRRDGEQAGWRVDVVKVAHHGSANRDDALLDLLAAPLAIVSVGAVNDYGHPAPSTLTALRDIGFQVRRTDLDGDIAVLRSADAVLRVAARPP